MEHYDFKTQINPDLIRRLLWGEEILLKDLWSGFSLRPEENEELRKVITAKILKGWEQNVLAVELQHVACLPNQKRGYYKMENYNIYDTEEIYRFPLTGNIDWLKKALILARDQTHSYFMNRV